MNTIYALSFYLSIAHQYFSERRDFFFFFFFLLMIFIAVNT